METTRRVLFLILWALVCGLLATNVAAAQESEFDEEFVEPGEDAPTNSPDAEFAGDADFSDAGQPDADAEFSDADAEFSEDGDIEDGEERVRAPSEEEDAAYMQGFRGFNTLMGPTGGLRIVDPRPAGVPSLHFQFALEFFSVSDFLTPDDSHDHSAAFVSMSWAPLDIFELSVGILSFNDTNSNHAPPLFQVLSDLVIDAKFGAPLSDVWSLGGDLSVYLPTTSELGLSPDTWSFGLRGSLAADFRGLSDPIPLIGRFNLGYRIDNTENLIAQTESDRYLGLNDAAAPDEEFRHLVTASERFSLGINRTDFLDFGLGFELPIQATSDLFISPLFEWRWNLPVNRQAYECVFVGSEPGSDVPPPGQDGCYANTGLSAAAMTLSFGVRVLPPVKGFSAFLAADIGLTGTSPEDQVRELAGNAPWNVMLGIGYAFDLRPTPDPIVEIREVVREEEVQEEAPPTGVVRGIVVDTETGDGIPNSRIHVTGETVTDQQTDTDGRFVTDQYGPGTEFTFDISAPEYETGQCVAQIGVEGADGDVRCELTHEPRLVVVEESEVTILEQINFALDSHRILPSSFALMDEIARTLNQHADIRRVEVQGHTDDLGDRAYNQGLSQRRADSVVRGLTERNVDGSRLTSVGHGLSRPLVPNTTPENRARNRRVQFIILERASPE